NWHSLTITRVASRVFRFWAFYFAPVYPPISNNKKTRGHEIDVALRVMRGIAYFVTASSGAYRRRISLCKSSKLNYERLAKSNNVCVRVLFHPSRLILV